MTSRAARIALPRLSLLLAFLGVGTGTAALAQPAHRVADLNTTVNGFATYPWEPDAVTVSGIAFFVASDGVAGAELWKSDGTAAGTLRVRDICPGSCPSGPLFLTAVGNELFFTADDGAHGREIWKSDGTEAGTVLVKDIVSGLPGASPGQLAEINGLLFFTADDGLHGSEPWVSDGTVAGTVLLADAQPGTAASSPWLLGKLGTTLFFSADDGVHGIELWKTDGTPGGTGFVKDIYPGSGSSLTFGSPFFLPKAAAVAGRLLFAADDGTHGNELWATDGTGPGTVPVGDLSPGSDPSGPFDFVAAGTLVYFEARDPAHGQELWASDGTPGGTAMVQDINPGTGGSSPTELTAVGSLVFFSADDGAGGHGRELWKSDGTPGGTVMVKDINPGTGWGLQGVFPTGAVAASNRLFFFANDGVHGIEPWVSDGSDAGTIPLADLNPGSANSFLGQGFGRYRNTFAAGRFFFNAYSPATGAEIFVSDGNPGGTGLLTQIHHQASSFDLAFLGSGLATTGSLADLGGTLVFQATDGVSGEELWKSDGTAAGTTQVADLVPGVNGSFPGSLTAFGGALFFTTQTGTNDGLWKTDGTTAGTTQISTVVVSDLRAVGGTLFFTGDDGAHGVELWKSDGTGPGTALLQDIAPGSPASSPYQLTAFGSALLFGATGQENAELWRSDGTPAGTAIVKDIQPGTGASLPFGLTVAGTRLFFSADDGTAGRELWATDGTGPGTYRVKDIHPGAAAGLAVTYDPPGAFAVLGNTLFFPADDGVHGFELWKSDGTEAGTVLVKDIAPGSPSSGILSLTAAFDRVYFVADDGTHGRELWVSDGTEAGTTLVADLLPGPGSSLPQELHAVGRRLVFSAYDGVHGRELWKTNGTAADTVLLEDINPGPESSSPLAFTESGGTLYFVANDGITGFELWALPLATVADALDFYTVAPCRIADTRTSTPMTSGVVRTFTLTGNCGIPATARTVATNLTVIHPGGPGFLRVYPSGGTVPMTSVLNVNSGGTRTNNALLTLSGGNIDAFLSLSGGGGADLVIDVVGYFQ